MTSKCEGSFLKLFVNNAKKLLELRIVLLTKASVEYALIKLITDINYSDLNFI